MLPVSGAFVDDGGPLLMYLPQGFWSSEYDDSFFSVKIEGKELLSELPPEPSFSVGRTTLPAFYFKVKVFRGRETKIVMRRFSQFYWLYSQVKARPPIEQGGGLDSNAPLLMPKKSSFFDFDFFDFYKDRSETFANSRQKQLEKFLADLLGRPGYANHPAVIMFLELK